MSEAAQPRISVALCTYNGERFLRDQLASVSSQSVPPHEVVIADDGSTDSTLDIARAWAESVPFAVTILDEPFQQGVTANFERAIRATTGDVVVLSDQDDVWHPDRVRASAAALASPGVLAVHSDGHLIGPSGDALGGTILERLALTADERRALVSGDLFATYLRRNLATGATMAVTRELVDAALPFPATWLHDEWLAMLAAAGDGLRYVDQPLISYRLHGNNVVGVTKPTLGYRVRKVLEPQGDRLARLVERMEALAARWSGLTAIEARIDPGEWAARSIAVEAKVRFERMRTGMPRARVSRWGTVARLARSGSYAAYASRGRMDMIRDALHSGGAR